MIWIERVVKAPVPLSQLFCVVISYAIKRCLKPFKNADLKCEKLFTLPADLDFSLPCLAVPCSLGGEEIGGGGCSWFLLLCSLLSP